jgi:hypothetical protein
MRIAGAINMALSKNKKEREQISLNDISIDSNNKTNINQINTENYNYKKIKLRNLPYFFWLLGLAFIAAGLIISYNMIEANNPNKRLFNAFLGKSAWEYIVLVFIFIIGLSLFVVAKYEMIILDRSV